MAITAKQHRRISKELTVYEVSLPYEKSPQTLMITGLAGFLTISAAAEW